MTLDHVARLAGVSTATASRVLNNTGIVRDTTRARVLKTIEELKYSPNLHARSLAGGKSRTIGVIVSNIENPFFLDIYKVVESRAHSAGFELVMANTDYSLERLRASVRLMIGRRLAGLAALVSELDSALIDEINGIGIPVVLYDVSKPRRNVTNIRVDHRRGMEKLVSYLYDLGHQRVGLAGHHAMGEPMSARMKLALDAVARLSGFQAETAGDADSLDGGQRAARALLNADPNLTAILCLSDLMAVGALRELRERGVRVPQDVSVTGYDNIKWAQFCDPALTSVDIPRDRIGQIICDCLMTTGSRPLKKEFLIDPELVVRDSTGPALAKEGVIAQGKGTLLPALGARIGGHRR